MIVSQLHKKTFMNSSFPNLLFISHDLLLYVVLIFLIKKKKKRKPRSRSPVVITKRQSRNADRAHGSRIVGRRQHLWQRPSLRAETWRSGFEIIPVQMSPLSCKQFVRAGQVRNSLKSRSEQISPCKASCEKQGWKDMKALALGPYCLLPSSPPTPECKGAGEKEGRKDTEWGGENVLVTLCSRLQLIQDEDRHLLCLEPCLSLSHEHTCDGPSPLMFLLFTPLSLHLGQDFVCAGFSFHLVFVHGKLLNYISSAFLLHFCWIWRSMEYMENLTQLQFLKTL